MGQPLSLEIISGDYGWTSIDRSFYRIDLFMLPEKREVQMICS